MATLTAQILIGEPHQNHGGIGPSHYLFLSENSRPAWILLPQNIFGGTKKDAAKITWIPTVKDMLEDALLMVALYIKKDQKLLEMARSFSPKIDSERLELYNDLDESQRRELYQRCRELQGLPKIIITVFRGSTIEKQLPVLEQYKMDVEVCTPVYSRLSSAWSKDVEIKGSLQ